MTVRITGSKTADLYAEKRGNPNANWYRDLIGQELDTIYVDIGVLRVVSRPHFQKFIFSDDCEIVHK